MEHEEWRTITGFNGAYSVSSLGRVRSEHRTRRGKSGAPTPVPQRILRAQQNRDGHMRVVLCAPGGKTTAFVHALVLTAHVGPRPAGHQACHRNGDASDNRVENLRWGTAASNQQDRIAHGTTSRGASNGSAKLTEEQVRAIRADSRKHADIAAELGVARTTVGLVKAGKSWTHIGDSQ
jgi:hypothetical protein